jgi:transposase-like protein
VKIEEIRREIETARWDGHRRWYSAELKAKIIAHGQARLKEGWKIGRIAEELGLSYHTLGPWMRTVGDGEKHDAGDEMKSALVPVRLCVAPDSMAPQLVLVNRRGFRLEGLDVEQAVVLMERLS